MQLSGLELGAMATAGIGGVTAFWSQVQGFWIRLRSLFFVTVELPGNCGDHFVEYCWRHFKSLNIGQRRFTSSQTFIIPNKNFGYVVHEESGRALTYFEGWKPIFLSMPGDSNSEQKLSASFIRGTFDIEKLLFESAQFHNKKNREGYKTTNFRIKKVFGSNLFGMDNNQNGHSPSKAHSEQADHTSPEGSRPIGWKPEDLGAPTSQTPFINLAYEKHIVDFKQELIRWKESKDWFRSKGIPWRFGAGLYGPPGTGKSSFIRAAAQELDIPVHIYDLTTMSNKELVEFWSESLLVAPCMVVFEDIDRIFDKDKNIKNSEKKDPLTLDCLLNCINGVQEAEGILVMVTANDMSKVDPALGVPDSDGNSTRPGRLDRAVYFGPTTFEMREPIANRILSDFPELIPQILIDGEGDSGAQFEGRCSKLALEKYWGGFKEYAAK